MAAQQHKEEQPTAMKVAVLPCGAGDNAINPIYVLKELHKLAIRIDLNLAKLANTGTRRYTLALIGNGEKPCPREYVAVLNSLDFWLRGFATTTDYLCHTRPELSPAQIRELKAWIQRSVLTIVAFRRAYPLKKMDRVLFEASQYGIVPIESMVAAGTNSLAPPLPIVYDSAISRAKGTTENRPRVHNERWNELEEDWVFL